MRIELTFYRELFSSLLGQRVMVDEDSDEDMEDIVPDDGLRLFR